MRLAVKLVPLGVLGCAAALLVACGDGNGLLSGSQSSSLQDALSSVQSACSAGDAGRAGVAAQSFSDRVNALPAGAVDRRLIADLQDGAAKLETLVPRTCTGTTTATTTTTTTATTPTTTVPTTTTAPTTTETTPTTPTTTTPTTPTTTTPPANGGRGGGGPGDSGGAPADSGGASPGQVKKALKRFEKDAKR
jgi:hypothetical protein